jgi:hypothetical protein
MVEPYSPVHKGRGLKVLRMNWNSESLLAL